MFELIVRVNEQLGVVTDLASCFFEKAQIRLILLLATDLQVHQFTTFVLPRLNLIPTEKHNKINLSLRIKNIVTIELPPLLTA